MKLLVGKYYVNKRDDLIGPMRPDLDVADGSVFCAVEVLCPDGGDWYYDEDGTLTGCAKSKGCLVREATPEEVAAATEAS